MKNEERTTSNEQPLLPQTLARRRFRFSLRALLIAVTLLSVWLGYQWNWMKQRQDFLANHRPAAAFPWGQSSPNVRAPQFLPMLGEVGYAELEISMSSAIGEPLSADDQRLLKQAARLFPETSQFLLWLPNNGYSKGVSDWPPYRQIMTPQDIAALRP